MNLLCINSLSFLCDIPTSFLKGGGMRRSNDVSNVGRQVLVLGIAWWRSGGLQKRSMWMIARWRGGKCRGAIEKKFDIKIFFFAQSIFKVCVELYDDQLLVEHNSSKWKRQDKWWYLCCLWGLNFSFDGKSGCVQNINFSLLRSNLSPFMWSENVDCEVAEWFFQNSHIFPFFLGGDRP